jgi:predicted NBD/HSP70 family sugar kinase
MKKLDHRAFDTARLSFYATSLLAALEDEAAADLVAEAGSKLAPAIDSVAKLLGPEMIVLSGYLGANETYFDGALTALSDGFDFPESSGFQLVKGTISSAESAALLALHAFCYSDRLDYERFADRGERAGDAAHG